MSLIKILALKKHVIININQKRKISEIALNPIKTFEIINTQKKLERITFIIKFYIVPADFLMPKPD